MNIRRIINTRSTLFALAASALLLVACSDRDTGGEADAVPPSPRSELDAPIAAVLPAPLPPITDTTYRYSTKTPYQPPADLTYEAAPPGFRLIMVQHVARHGSRGLSSPDDDDLSLQLWEQARTEGALTSLGEELGPVLRRIRILHQEQLGYGELSALGRLEHRRMARRLVQRHPDFFAAIVDEDRPLRIEHSGRSRAADSGEHFRLGLLEAEPALESLIQPSVASPDTLYFYKAEGSEEYRAYRRYMKENPRLDHVLGRIENDPRTRQVARELLKRLYTEDFVARLAAGRYRFEAVDDDDELENELDAALALYGLYSISINLSEEAVLDFERFISDDHAAWLGYIDDAESFYERGPGFAGEDITWRAAEILVADMVGRIEGLVEGRHRGAADLRFTHAQVLIPLAAYLGIEGASEGMPSDEPFHYDNSPWRSALVAPMSANVQWDVYENEAGTVLITQLHHERQIPFKSDCPAYDDSGYYYELDALKACYGWAD